MKHLLLHQNHGTADWKLLKEGSDSEIQAFLTAHGCQEASHYRVIRGDELRVERRAKSPTLTVFYTASL